MLPNHNLSVAKVAEWMAAEDSHSDWRRQVDLVLADVLALTHRRLFISAAKRMGEARKSLELHLQTEAVFTTVDALADAISSWDARSCHELGNRLRTELQ